MDGDERKVSTIPETASTRSRPTAGSRDAADAPEHCAIYQLLGRAADDLGTKTAGRQSKMIKTEYKRLEALPFDFASRIKTSISAHTPSYSSGRRPTFQTPHTGRFKY
jgi:magnesium-transporting ATPase (P-type)